MIISGLLNLIKTLLFVIFGWINLPPFPEGITSSINYFIDNILGSGFTLLGFFIRPLTMQIVVPILIILINFDKVIDLTMWIIKKIPFLGIK